MTTTGAEPLRRLLGPLPEDARVQRALVAAPGSDAGPVAGWETLVVETGVPPSELRVVQVTLDAAGTPISASDHVLVRYPDGRIVQESIGGRFEPDGSFHGTHWRSEGTERDDVEEIEWNMVPRGPSAAECDAIRALAADVLRRAGPASLN